MAPCNPPLHFVSNGAAGSAFPPPLDPTPPQFGPPSPTFEQSACDILGTDLCSAMDSISAIDELPALVDSIDALTSAADANLDAILLELDQLGQDQVNKAFDDFSGAQPGAMSLLGDITGITVPALGEIPISSPTGGAVVTPGAPAAGGGIATAGSAPYVLHHPIPFAFDPNRLVGAPQLTGPNPPFVSVAGFHLDDPTKGVGGWAALIEINPAHAGNFAGTLSYSLAVTFTGINTIIKYSLGVTVVVQ